MSRRKDAEVGNIIHVRRSPSDPCAPAIVTATGRVLVVTEFPSGSAPAPGTRVASAEWHWGTDHK
jgi:hypothetical protein